MASVIWQIRYQHFPAVEESNRRSVLTGLWAGGSAGSGRFNYIVKVPVEVCLYCLQESRACVLSYFLYSMQAMKFMFPSPKGYFE